MKQRQLLVKIKDETINLYDNGWMQASVLIAIAGRKPLWDEINDEYLQHEKEAVVAYRNSNLYELPILKTLTTPVKVMSIKAFSLYALYQQQGTEEAFLEQKIKKAFNRYVNYLSSSTTFHWVALMNYIEEREPELTETEKHDIFMVVMYLLGEQAPAHMTNIYGQSIMSNVIQNMKITASGDEVFHRKKERIEKEALQAISKTLGFKMPKVMNVDKLIGNHESYLIKNELTPAEKKTIANNDDYHLLYVKGLYRYFKPLTAIMRDMNLNDFNFLATVEVTRDELVRVYAMFDSAVELGRITKEEWEMYFVSSLIILMLGKHYHQLSDFYLDAMKEKEEKILSTHEEKEQETNWRKERERLHQDNNELERKIQHQDAYILELEKKLKQKEIEIKEEESLKKEVVALRNYAHQHQEEIPDVTTNDVAEVTLLKDWAKEHRAVVFGGHPNLVNKLKSEMPTMEYRDVDTLNRDLDFLQNQEVVFLVTNYFNHPFYYKLMSELQKLPQTKLVYLSGYPNTERTMNEMWRGLEDVHSVE